MFLLRIASSLLIICSVVEWPSYSSQSQQRISLVSPWIKWLFVCDAIYGSLVCTVCTCLHLLVQSIIWRSARDNTVHCLMWSMRKVGNQQSTCVIVIVFKVYVISIVRGLFEVLVGREDKTCSNLLQTARLLLTRFRHYLFAHCSCSPVVLLNLFDCRRRWWSGADPCCFVGVSSYATLEQATWRSIKNYHLIPWIRTNFDFAEKHGPEV